MSPKEIALKMLPGLRCASMGTTLFIIHELDVNAGKTAAIYGVAEDESAAWTQAVEVLKGFGYERHDTGCDIWITRCRCLKPFDLW